jgi:hypothetical protein
VLANEGRLFRIEPQLSPIGALKVVAIPALTHQADR